MQWDYIARVSGGFPNYGNAKGLISGFDLIALAICLTPLLVILLHYFVIAPIAYGPLSHVPGPVLCKLSWHYLSYFNISLQRTETICKWHARYGAVVCIGPEEVSLATPSLMREIYGNSGRYAKSKFFDHFIAYGERSLFATRPYAAHRQKRDLIAPFYQSVGKPWVELFVNERVSAVISQIDNKLDITSLDVYQLASHFAFDNISRLLFGKTFCSHAIEMDGEERRILAKLKKAQLWGPFQMDYPRVYGLIKRLLSLSNYHRDSFHADDELLRWTIHKVTEIIVGGRAAEDNEDTLIHRLSSVRNPEGVPLSLNYIVSELYDNMMAAEVTVAVTLTYVIYHLSENPVWQSRICQEMLSLPSEGNGFPSFASINSAPILDAFIREVYRMNPGTGGHAERVVPDGGRMYDHIHIPEGVRVTASTMALHRDAAVFPNPGSFDPERWLGKDYEQTRTINKSLIPFGYGARVCAGKLFATMEIKMLIARLYTRYRTRIDPNSGMTKDSMLQYATHDSVPRGLRCDISFDLLEKGTETIRRTTNLEQRSRFETSQGD